MGGVSNKHCGLCSEHFSLGGVCIHVGVQPQSHHDSDIEYRVIFGLYVINISLIFIHIGVFEFELYYHYITTINHY